MKIVFFVCLFSRPHWRAWRTSFSPQAVVCHHCHRKVKWPTTAMFSLLGANDLWWNYRLQSFRRAWVEFTQKPKEDNFLSRYFSVEGEKNIRLSWVKYLLTYGHEISVKIMDTRGQKKFLWLEVQLRNNGRSSVDKKELGAELLLLQLM